ncbi:HNH endonuclease [Pseudonocardia hispaniensis]|uniref:HNH endonuclease n=1 Tax=Pseudonocardia hispaniensis TaxID=904933 RepID=A0ABW1IWN3_9PSEU
MSRPPLRSDLPALLVRVFVHTERQGECLVYTRARSTAGYGQIWAGERLEYTHRIVAEAVHGPPPTPEHEVLHSCDNPPCLDPAHIRWGLHIDNVREMHVRGRARPSGTKLTVEDVRVIKRRLANGEMQRNIAKDYGVTDGTINHIARGSSWKRVTI